MSKVDAILERFPGPVTLHMSWRRKLVGLVINIGFVLFIIWLLYTGDVARTSRTAGYDLVLAWISLFVFGALAIRGILLFLLPGAARLTLDADGFEIAYIFSRFRHSWREVSALRAETAHSQIKFDLHTERGGAASREVLPVYGLSKDDFIHLMNTWRGRARETR